MLQILVCYITSVAMSFTRFLVKEGRKKGRKEEGERERKEGRKRREEWREREEVRGEKRGRICQPSSFLLPFLSSLLPSCSPAYLSAPYFPPGSI